MSTNVTDGPVQRQGGAARLVSSAKCQQCCIVREVEAGHLQTFGLGALRGGHTATAARYCMGVLLRGYTVCDYKDGDMCLLPGWIRIGSSCGRHVMCHHARLFWGLTIRLTF